MGKKQTLSFSIVRDKTRTYKKSLEAYVLSVAFYQRPHIFHAQTHIFLALHFASLNSSRLLYPQQDGNVNHQLVTCEPHDHKRFTIQEFIIVTKNAVQDLHLATCLKPSL